jgi:hypothetical protein
MKNCEKPRFLDFPRVIGLVLGFETAVVQPPKDLQKPDMIIVFSIPTVSFGL